MPRGNGSTTPPAEIHGVARQPPASPPHCESSVQGPSELAVVPKMQRPAPLMSWMLYVLAIGCPATIGAQTSSSRSTSSTNASICPLTVSTSPCVVQSVPPSAFEKAAVNLVSHLPILVGSSEARPAAAVFALTPSRHDALLPAALIFPP